jgi:hypothetical protein
MTDFDLERLAVQQAVIDSLDAERAAAIERLDDEIRALREAGCTWSAINDATGLTNMQMSFSRREARR